nr:hypothetical protein GCM10020092_078250 [Actinoplanes digitatis]
MVDLFDQALADVTDPQRVVGLVDGEPPRVAQPVEPDLRPRARRPDERVGGRNAVGLRTAGAVDVDPHDLAEQGAEVLAGLERVVRVAAVAGGPVEVAVAAERHLPAVVVAVLGVLLGQQHL